MRGRDQPAARPPGEDVDQLVSVLGRARERVLVALVTPHTTAEVARVVGSANSTVSEHLSALVEAGLAVRRRERRLVYYEVSERGCRLLALLGKQTLEARAST